METIVNNLVDRIKAELNDIEGLYYDHHEVEPNNNHLIDVTFAWKEGMLDAISIISPELHENVIKQLKDE